MKAGITNLAIKLQEKFGLNAEFSLPQLEETCKKIRGNLIAPKELKCLAKGVETWRDMGETRRSVLYLRRKGEKYYLEEENQTSG